MRRLCTALAVLVVTAVLAGFAPPAFAAPVTYVAPVSGHVVDGFRPPSTPYGRGNRGLTYETEPGSPVRSSAPGRVSFAGQVGGALHVVVQHADGVRTSYAFLRSVRVRAGQEVRQSDLVGTANESFHFGARIGDAYVDPAILLASGPARVHLVPDGEFAEEGASNDGFALMQIVRDLPSIAAQSFEWVKDRGGNIADAARILRDGAVDLAQLANGTADALTRAATEHLITVLDEIVNVGQWAGPAASLAAVLATVLQNWLEPCTPAHVAPPPMRQSEDRIAVFVAGLGSKSRSRLSKDFHAEELGYAPEHIYDFSYRGGRDPQPYRPADTTGDLRDRARDLRALLDQIARDHPGKRVDVIAHSQGGLIAREAMAHDYDSADHTLPPIAHVVTLGTPHHGADAATANAWLRWSRGGRAIRFIAKKMHKPFDLTGPGVAQLAETSDFIRSLNARDLREGIAYTSIGAAQDFIAPAVRTRLAGASNVLVDVGGFAESHSALHDSEVARRELQLAVADAPPTCQSLSATAAHGMWGAVIATGEDVAGATAAAGAARI